MKIHIITEGEILLGTVDVTDTVWKIGDQGFTNTEVLEFDFIRDGVPHGICFVTEDNVVVVRGPFSVKEGRVKKGERVRFAVNAIYYRPFVDPIRRIATWATRAS